ncbi:MAG: cytochrome c [Candidatus Melainabacteria bacterium]|nr:cytochrome c [Candidatus Melainabacteria bacterium]
MNLRRQKTGGIAIVVFAIALMQSAFAGSSDQTTSKGAQLLEKEGCLHCHYVGGRGGFVGPPFEGISKYRSEEDIINTLTNKRPLPPRHPRGVFDAGEFMRHVRVDKKTAEEISKYLISFPAKGSFIVKGHGETADDLPGGFTFVPQEPSEQTRMGLRVYKEGGCAACHEIGGIGGRIGPQLDGIGARLSKTAIGNRITTGATVMFNEKEYRPTEYSMPPTELPKDQIRAITEFLLTLPAKTK